MNEHLTVDDTKMKKEGDTSEQIYGYRLDITLILKGLSRLKNKKFK